MPNENGSRVNQGYKPLANNVAEAESEFDMDKKPRKITPEVNARILSKLTFSWFTPKLEDACDHVLELDEYYELPINSSSPEFLVPFFEEVWKMELNRKKITTILSNEDNSFDLYNNVKYIDKRNPSLVKALYHCFKKEFYSVLFLVIVSNLLITMQILLIRLLLTKIQSMNDYFVDFNIENETNTEIPTWALLIGVVPQRFNRKVAKDGIFIVMIMTMVNILFPVFRQQETRLVTRVGRNVRSLMTGVVYRKVLKMDSNMFRDNSNNNYCGDNDNSIKRTRLSVASILSESAANDTNGLFGSVVNLLSNDVSRFSRLYNSHEFYSGVVSIIISLFSLYFVLGVPGLAGMLIMGFHIAWSVTSLNYRVYERKSFSEIRDKRILLTSEYLSCIKIIKSYSWEESFVKEINKYRINEISSLLFQGIYWSLSTFCHAVVLHSTLITILMLKYMGKKIDPANIFFALVFYDAVSEVVISFPKSYALFRDLILSCERIKEFLLLEDKETVNKNDFYNNLYCSFSKNEINDHSGLVCYNNVELRWKDGHLLLNNLNFKLKSGELMGIIGPVGCGKSGLLISVINEIIPTKGSIGIKGSTAYVPQLAWIFTGTIRENIIFGSEFNQKWYDQVISACSLTEDFKLFPNGDQTVVGGKENNLSGGQKQRICLARAVYKNSQIYVLDDCLSAVDSNVSSQIFKNCITGLLKNKCVILATHLLDIVPYMDYVLLLDGSKKCPIYSGDPKGLTKISEFRRIFEDIKLSKNVRDADTSGSNIDNDIVSNYSNNDKNNIEPYFKTNNQNSNKSTENMKHISLEEDDVEGIVTLGTYVKYMRSYNKYYLIGAFSFGFISTLLNILISFYVGYWTEHFYELEWRFYFGLFVSLSVIFPIVVVTTTGFFKLGGLNVSNKFHDKLLKHIENAPLRFFENTPIGRILNRFTSDLVNVDELLPTDFNNATIAVVTCGIILISTGFITPQFFVCLPILFYAFYCIVKKYPPILRQAERRSAALSAPITSHTIETIMGLTTIHTFNTEDMLTKKLDNSVLLLSNVRYHVDTAYSWLNLRLEIIASITLVFSGTFGVLLSCCNKNYAGIFGTILSFAVTLPGWLRYTVFTLGEFEADMVGFERIRNYTDSELVEVSIFNERNLDDNNGKLTHPNWPEKGRIEFKNVYLSFDPNLMNYILKNISFNINHGERVGIVGRTGAGKSSLFTVLLRLYNPSNGNILIDGVDTASIPVRELRNRISIVPQDPIIFTGSIRFNLDPNNQFTDDELYNVLKRVHIYDYVMALPDKLDHFFVSGGGTLSVGIKQLFCLARAVLKKSKILLLDEATSFIDVYTDSLIQETISKEFKDSTIITIAHRIKTVINYDKIMVLDSGKIIEFNSPEELLNNPNSTFKLLASSTI